MKTKQLFILLLTVTITLLFAQCNKDDDDIDNDNTILPTAFMVDIPESISKSSLQSKGDTKDSLEVSGNDLYTNLRTFVGVGEDAALLVQAIIFAIVVYDINEPMSFTYESNDDQRTKRLVVVENSSFNNVNWEFQLTITDVESESNADGGKAMQVFWNRSPKKGIAIVKPHNIDMDNAEFPEDVMYSVEYSEEGEMGYEKHMIVSITGLPSIDPEHHPFEITALKMFAGKNGDVIDVFGNSNHPNAPFFTTPGVDWAFVGSAEDNLDIGVAEVGLPPNDLDETNSDVLLENYSMMTVLSAYCTALGLDSATTASLLVNADAPGYFDHNGFVTGGTPPAGTESMYEDLENNIEYLSPYNPKLINDLVISFKD